MASDLSLLAVCQVATVRAALFWLVPHVVGIGTLVVSDYNHHMPLLNRPILLYRGVKPSLLLIVGDVTKALDLKTNYCPMRVPSRSEIRLKSIQKRYSSPSFFFTNRIGDAHGEDDGSIMSSRNISATEFSTIFRLVSGVR